MWLISSYVLVKKYFSNYSKNLEKTSKQKQKNLLFSGAPLLNQHWETCSFVTLLCFQTIWPILLIEGITDVKKFQNLVQGQHLDELGQVLYFQAAGKQHFLLFLKRSGIYIFSSL